jgi:hypothetical protein
VNAIHSVDLFLLKRILRLREFCEEWLSVSCQRFERGLIVLCIRRRSWWRTWYSAGGMLFAR